MTVSSGGVRVAVGDVNGDGMADIITGAGPGASLHIRVFSGQDFSVLHSSYAYDPQYAGGVFVGSGDLNGDFIADIITGTGNGAGPHVRAFDGRSGAELDNFMVNDPFSPNAIAQVPLELGISVAAVDLDGDGIEDILTGKGPGTRAYFRGFRITRYERPLKLAVPVGLEEFVRRQVYSDFYGYGINVG